MSVPSRVEDKRAYRGQEFRLPLEFTNSDGSPRNVADGFTWRVRVHTSLDCDATLDLSNASQGIIVFVLSAAVTEAIPEPFARWDLEEDAVLKDSVLKGRIVFEDHA